MAGLLIKIWTPKVQFSSPSPELQGRQGHIFAFIPTPPLAVFDGFRDVAEVMVTYTLLVLVFTLISLGVSSPASQSGTLRQLSAITPHLALLTLYGLVIGLAPALVTRKFNLPVLALIVSLTLITDLDHLPSLFGLAQPIRPAHSIVFLVVAVASVILVTRREDLCAATVTGFLVHMSVDTGVFPPLSPFSFAYSSLTNLSWAFLASSVVFALATGYLAGRTFHFADNWRRSAG